MFFTDWTFSAKFRSVLSDSDKLKVISNNLNFPEKFHDKCLSGRSCSWQLRLEPSHIASVLSRLTLSTAHFYENLLSINNDCSSDFELSSNINEESSAYWLNKNSESFIFTPVISGLFLIAALKSSKTRINK